MKTVAIALVTVLGLTLSASAGPFALQRAHAAIGVCRNASVQMSMSWQKKNATMPGGGAIDGAITLTPVGGARCTVSGWPKLRLFDASGRRLQVQQRTLPGPVSPPRPVRLSDTAKGRTSATVHVTWVNWCKGAVSRPLTMRVRLPGAAAFRSVAIRPGGKAVASCVNPTAGSVLDTGPFMASTR